MVKHMKRSKGLTLVEIIISMAIFGILSVVFINAFTMGFTRIVHSGHRTNAVGQAQEFFYSSPVITTSEVITIQLPVSASTTTAITVSGSYAKGNVTLNSGTSQEVDVEVMTFVPGLSLD